VAGGGAALGDPAGTRPRAGLDIERDAPDEPIEDVEILDLTTRNNRGPGLLIALGAHRPRNRSTVVVYQHTDSGSARPLQVYAMSTTGSLRIRGTDWGLWPPRS